MVSAHQAANVQGRTQRVPGRVDPPSMSAAVPAPVCPGSTRSCRTPALAFFRRLYLGYSSISSLHAALIEGGRPAWALGAPGHWRPGARSPSGIARAAGGPIHAGGAAWWFWDPVENASFMPWCVALPSCTRRWSSRKTRGAQNLDRPSCHHHFLAEPTRHVPGALGVLTSSRVCVRPDARGLHSSYWLSFYTGGALLLFAWRARNSPAGACRAIFARGRAGAEQFVLATAAATVLPARLYPLLLDCRRASEVSVGRPSTA